MGKMFVFNKKFNISYNNIFNIMLINTL